MNQVCPRDKSLADVHLEEQDDLETSLDEEKREISRKEYFLRLQELKGEINLAWRSEDRIRAWKLSIKVSKLLMDTSVLLFYPTFFTLVVDVMDMLGTLVWERIRMRAEYGDDGTLLRYLPEDFISDDICCEAKETCYNWFCKIGSIHEIVPRIYLELSILRCWRFLDNNFTSILQRLVMMMRGIAKPLASAYCHLYLANSVRFLCSGDDAMGLPSAIDANEGIQLCVFDSRRGQHEGQELDKILFFYPPDCPYSVQLSVIGLSGGMITFTRLFSPDAACEVIEAETLPCVLSSRAGYMDGFGNAHT